MLIVWQEDVVQRLFDDPEQLDNDHMDNVTLHQLQTTSASHQTVSLTLFQLFHFKSMACLVFFRIASYLLTSYSLHTD